MIAPLGIRLNNPGNIEQGDPWQGLAADQLHPRFCTFKEAKWGIRAIARILITYKDKHGICSIFDAISRWAPEDDNNPTLAYSLFVAKRARLETTVVDFTEYEVAKGVVKGIIEFENGVQPYDDATIDAGLRLAGIEVPPKPLTKSRTIVASTAAGAATATPIMVDAANQIPAIKQALEPLADSFEWVRPALVLLTLVSIGVVIWARIDDQNSERRA